MSYKILVPGSFDIFHLGHLVFLNEVAKHGVVTIALGTDAYQEGYKRKPVQSFAFRKRFLEELGYQVLTRDKQTIEGMFQTHDFDAIAVGTDWIEEGIDKFLNLCGLSPYYLEKHNIHVLIIPNVRYMSTTKIIEDVQAQFNK